MKKSVIFLYFLLLSAAALAQPTKEEIQQKQRDLQRELAELNRTLDEIKSSKKSSLAQLNAVQRKIQAREELINNINKEMNRLDDDIYLTTLEMNKLKRELDTLKQQYAKSLQFAYKNRSNYDYLNFLFSSSSFNDAIKRVAYLKSYRSYRETQAATINQTTNLLATKATVLSTRKNEKNLAIQEQSKQLGVLEQDKKEKDQVVQQLKGREKDLAKEIQARERQRIKLQQSLQAIIRREIEEAKRKEKERLAKMAEDEKKKRDAELARIRDANAAKNAPPSKSPPTPVDPDAGSKGAIAVGGGTKTRVYSPLESTPEGLTLSLNFENNKGKLPWPVDKGNIVLHFGTYEVPNTKLKNVSDGIDIEMPAGTAVKAVADGEITEIYDLGEQTIVVRHGKYFSTYSNLNSVQVKRGQAIKAGTVLGKASADADGDGMVTFMLTNDKGVNLNPESWLRRR
ncbi:MAG: hypothetical protein EAZ47_02805 [Bacteroidetes bacterium]|nr:MAG: hypothetical protein EAY72_10605 [Bacteroidota bacterium]TAF95956.1 MAG: hypothetical protein EAZ47_02805 [Bacteroidota bacterium]